MRTATLRRENSLDLLVLKFNTSSASGVSAELRLVGALDQGPVHAIGLEEGVALRAQTRRRNAVPA